MSPQKGPVDVTPNLGVVCPNPIKYTKSTITKQPIVQKMFCLWMDPKLVIDAQRKGFENGDYLETS